MRKWWVEFYSETYESQLDVDVEAVSETEAKAKAYEKASELLKDVNTWKMNGAFSYDK